MYINLCCIHNSQQNVLHYLLKMAIVAWKLLKDCWIAWWSMMLHHFRQFLSSFQNRSVRHRIRFQWCYHDFGAVRRKQWSTSTGWPIWFNIARQLGCKCFICLWYMMSAVKSRVVRCVPHCSRTDWRKSTDLWLGVIDYGLIAIRWYSSIIDVLVRNHVHQFRYRFSCLYLLIYGLP